MSHYHPVPNRPWYRKKRVIIPTALTILFFSAAVASQQDATPAPSAAAEPGTLEMGEPARAMPVVGEAAADGDFTFVVSAVDCSSTEIGDRYINTRSQGVYCILDVSVTNNGKTSGSFSGDNAKMVDTVGQEFSVDTGASLYIPNSQSIYEEINPGNTLNSKLIFDVPEGTIPLTVELHDSAFSGGVTIALQ